MTAGLRELLENGVTAAPDAVVLQDAGTAVTWTTLRERARGFASGLVRSGVRSQDRVVLVAKNDLRFFDVLFGCGLAGPSSCR